MKGILNISTKPIWVNYYAQLLFKNTFFSEVSNPKVTDFLFDHQ